MQPTIHKIGDVSAWAVWVETDYDEDYVEAVKAMIKPRDRRWDATNKVWLFKAAAVDLVCVLLAKHFGGYAWAEDAPSTSLASIADAYAAMHLLPSAPPSLVRIAYRTLAKELHPDAGGDTSTMQRLNVAYELIETARR